MCENDVKLDDMNEEESGEEDNQTQLYNIEGQEGQGDILSIGVLLDTKTVQNKPIDEKAFVKGIKEYSYYAGAFSVLANAGIPAITAMNFILTLELAPMNERIIDKKCNAQVQTAKYIRNNMEKDII